MNEINTARRLREAATEKAEANKILKVTLEKSASPNVHQFFYPAQSIEPSFSLCAH